MYHVNWYLQQQDRMLSNPVRFNIFCNWPNFQVPGLVWSSVAVKTSYFEVLISEMTNWPLNYDQNSNLQDCFIILLYCLSTSSFVSSAEEYYASDTGQALLFL